MVGTRAVVKVKRGNNIGRRAMYRTAGYVAGRVARGLVSYASRRLQRKPIGNRRLYTKVRPVGTGSSLSYFKSGRKAKLAGKVLKTMQPLRVMNQATSNRNEGAIGFQAVTSERFLTVGQIQELFTQLTAGGSNTQRLYVRQVTSDFLITNATSSNTFIRLYELVARRDFMTTTTSSGALSSAAIWTPEGAFDQGMFDVSASTSNCATAIGSTPFQSKLFSDLWKVKRVFNIELGSGRSHKHSTTYNINRFIDESILGTTASRRNQILGGITRAIMIVSYGAPINSDATDTNVSTAKTALNIVRLDRHYINALDPQGQQYYRTSTIPVVTDPQEVDDEGNVQTPAEA